jgi:6-phosphogluconolactonase
MVVIKNMFPEKLKPIMSSADRKFFYSDKEAEIAEHAAALIISEAYRAVADHGRFSLVLAGGNSPRLLYEKLARGITTKVLEHYALPVPPDGSPDGRESIHLLPLETWLFQGDERCVPFNHPDSNYRMITETLLKHSGMTKDHLLRMVTEHADNELAAREYEAAIRSFFFSDGKLPKQSFPIFDLILLGLGEDGHTASLFAGNSDALNERKRWVIPVNAPQAKPPGMRLTLTMPVINHARNVLFYTTGREKHELARKIFLEKEKGVPASQVNPENGKLFWFAVQP